jgi:putative endonuclease
MWFSRKQDAKNAKPAAIQAPAGQVTTKDRGDAAEAAAQQFLTSQGLRLLTTNFRTPGRGGGEIDLIMQDPDGTLVFAEVRQRSSASHGGAGASISPAKQRRIVLAATHYLMRYASGPPPCRFDVVTVEGALTGAAPPQVQWLQGAFDASGNG